MSPLSFQGSFMIGSLGIPSAVLFLLVLAVTSVLYGVVAGRDRVVHVLISLYLALAIVTNVPVLGYVHQWFHSIQNATVQLVWFLGMFLAVFFVLWRSKILRGMAKERGHWWEACLFSLLQTTLTITIVCLLLPIETTNILPPLLKNLFLTDIGRSLWLLAPFVALVALGRDGGGETLELEA